MINGFFWSIFYLFLLIIKQNTVILCIRPETADFGCLSGIRFLRQVNVTEKMELDKLSLYLKQLILAKRSFCNVKNTFISLISKEIIPLKCYFFFGIENEHFTSHRQ